VPVHPHLVAVRVHPDTHFGNPLSIHGHPPLADPVFRSPPGRQTRIGEELDQIRSYLKIEQARFGDRVRSQWQLDDHVEDMKIPSLIIQPLVENGVKHGILGKDEGGTISIRIGNGDGLLHVEIEDDGVGMSREVLHNVLACKDEFSGDDHIGVRNCNQRLEQIYGPQHTLSFTSRPGRGTLVSFTIPQTAEAAA